MEKEAIKIFVLDTNVLLHEPLAIYSFKEHDVVIPMTVLEELDQIKDRKRDVSRDARIAIKTLDKILGDASPEQMLNGVPIPHTGNLDLSLGHLSIYPDHIRHEQVKLLPKENNDNLIINTALNLQKEFSNRKVILVTKDINMRLKAKGAGLSYVEDYRTDQIIDDVRLLSKGFVTFEGDFWSRLKSVYTQLEGHQAVHRVPLSEFQDEPLNVNQYLIDDTKQFCARVKSMDDDFATLVDLGREPLMRQRAWGVTPKNIYQGMAMEALLDPNIDMVILTGPAGCGKTLLAMAAALETVIERSQYERVLVTRNTPEIAESIGFLPGSEEEKMLPWLGGITDTLEVLHKHDENPRCSMNYIMEKANIQFKSVNFMRGRSIQNSFVLLDECQNLTASQVKTIITRMGHGSKLVCSGNLAQIDSNYLTSVTSGLTYIVERFKSFEGSANIYLNGVQRSRLASFAEEQL